MSGCCWRTIVDQNHEPKDGLFCNVIVRDPTQQNTWIYDSNGIFSEGTAGKAATITVGATTTGEPGTDAKVENVGDVSQAVLDFTIPRGDKGDKGDKGDQGDTGSQGPQGEPGPKGDPGEPFQIRKIYDSVASMEADYNNPDIEEGDFVMIETGDVDDPDNSKLYVKGPTSWQFVTDLSGAQGIQGPQGDPGTPAGFGNITATVDETTSTPQVSVMADGPNTAKNISFSFTGLKGEKGDKGDPGQDGTQVNNIAPLVVGIAPSAEDAEKTIAIGSGAEATLPSSAGGNGGITIGHSSSGAGIVVGHASSSGDAANDRQGNIVIGNSSKLSSFSNVAIGNNINSSSSSNVVIGGSATGSGSCVSVGVSSDGGINGVAVGHGAATNTTGSFSQGVAIGYESSTGSYVNESGISIGEGVSSEGGIAIGGGYADNSYHGTTTSHGRDIVIGHGSDGGESAGSISSPNIVIGHKIALRNSSTTNGEPSNIIIGTLNRDEENQAAKLGHAVIVGNDNDVSGINSPNSKNFSPTTIVGSSNVFKDGWGSGANDPTGNPGNPYNTVYNSVLGSANTINGHNSVVIGMSNIAELSRSVVIGISNTAKNNLAVGSGTMHATAISIGRNAKADNYSIAIGLNGSGEHTVTYDEDDLPSNYDGNNHGIAIGRMTSSLSPNGIAMGWAATVASAATASIALGSQSVATDPYTFSVGSGDATMALSDDMDEETKVRIQARAAAATRRIVNVTDPRDAQDAATKNYVDTQLTPINAKLQYVPENTNQILSQIETNAEKAQSAAEAAQTTAESKANQSDLTALQTTVTQQAETIAQLQTTITQLQSQLNNLTLEVEEI